MITMAEPASASDLVISCPTVIIAAPECPEGRMGVTAAMARYHRNQGRKVQVLKAGADFFEPLVLEQASGAPVNVIDSWLVGESRCREVLCKTAREADLIIIETRAGLFDAYSPGSNLCAGLDLPVYLVMDGVFSMGSQSSNDVLINDVITLCSEMPVTGILVNRAPDDFNEQRFLSRLPPGIEFLGSTPPVDQLLIPDCHAELLHRPRKEELEVQLEAVAELISHTGLAELPPTVEYLSVTESAPPRLLEGVRIGVAKDEAFAYIYQANLDLIEQMGGEIEFFSPLHDRYVPMVDSLWFPGGFPELYLYELESNSTMKASIKDFHAHGKPILAECGGMMYMLGSLVDVSGKASSMVGLLPGSARFLGHATGAGLQAVAYDEQVMRGYVFHTSRLESGMQPASVSDSRHGRRPGESLYQYGSLTASYVHFYFPSNPLLTARFFGSPFFVND